MILQNKSFTASTLLQPNVSVLTKALARTPARVGTQIRAPHFLIVGDRVLGGWWGALGALCKPARLHLYAYPVRLFRQLPVAQFRFAGRPQILSVLLHVALFLWLPYLPFAMIRRPLASETGSREPAKIYYDLTLMDFSGRLPRIVSNGPGGHPNSSSEQVATPKALGSSVAHPKITIILKPPHPDNRRQTIYQSASAPDLRITMDLKLPNLMMGATVIPRPEIKFNASSSKPVQGKKSVAVEPAPALTANANPPAVLTSELTSSQLSPQVLPPAPVAPAQNQNEQAASGGTAPSGKEPGALVIVGVDPSPAMALVSLPAGNRWAELSISAGSEGGDSPGGNVGKGGGSGSVGVGTGRDASISVGRGESGGGVGSAAGTGILNITGVSSNNSLALDPMLPANMVYAISASVLPRKNALVVSAGPMGGGGLDVYGALHCGKIYTVFLQMPGKSWTLQFCQAKREARPNAISGQSAVVRLEQGLVPPEPEVRFDFRRLPLSAENAHKLILLKGLIREDGTVDLLEVYRALLLPMDEAARVAFSRWKFKPAMRDGRPVSVEILVGIPSEAPVSRAVR